MPAPQEILTLVSRFQDHYDSYRLPSYGETALRREFLDPFIKALGWDVDNDQGYAEAYKDVVHEDSIKIGVSTKAPDYSLRIGGVRKLFVEAKKPSVNIGKDVSPAFQLRRYAWSAKLPLSILTDFEEFAVYDCRVRPDKLDKASTARIMYLKYAEYDDRWDELASIFSPEAIRKGSFDKYAESTKKKRGTAEVDSAFLKEIEQWRSDLARNLASRNADLSQRELNYAVQKTIDRVVFLRICEDRGIEVYGGLQSLLNGEKVYARLSELFRKADDKYNSGLFHFNKEKYRHEDPDEWTLSLRIDDKVLKDIIRKLYYPESPYEFSVLGSDILGQVYEQFLGKVIRLTKGHQAKIEEKPEVKKAGGVYYTPTYIVSYIVEQTVGKLLEGKTPHEIAARTEKTWKRSKGGQPISVLDPACGSGSFLIGAYQYLLDWYRDWYVEHDPAKYKDRIYQTRHDRWRLTTAERKRILLDHIYGVDIDTQAVEVTKLSLLLKVLEGETTETLQRQLFAKQRALPDLANNIKCGNSLVGHDFYQGKQLDLFDEDERLRINVFDWSGKDGFREIMKSGGFEAVIGNPPYGFHQIHEDYVKPYFKSRYAASHGSFEHYFLFYEMALKLLKKHGMHGFIVPVTWLTIPSAKALRKLVLDSYRLTRIVWLPELVFVNAQVNTLVTIISADKPSETSVEIHTSLGFKEPASELRTYSQEAFRNNGYYIGIFERSDETSLIEKIERSSRPLSDFARPCSGYNPYEVGTGIRPEGGPHTKDTVMSKPYHSKTKINSLWKPEVVGRDLSRYRVDVTGQRWVKYGEWLAAQRDPNNFLGVRILVQEIVGGKERRIVGAYVDKELYHSRDVIPVKVESGKNEAYFLLAIINSRLMSWFHHKRNPKAKKGLFPKVLVSDLKKLPIKNPDKSKSMLSLHNKIVDAVKQIISLRAKEEVARTTHEQTAIRRQIDSTDAEIDRLVYELYGLTDDEIRIVEEATS